jgi:hypothetical protein
MKIENKWFLCPQETSPTYRAGIISRSENKYIKIFWTLPRTLANLNISRIILKYFLMMFAWEQLGGGKTVFPFIGAEEFVGKKTSTSIVYFDLCQAPKTISLLLIKPNPNQPGGSFYESTIPKTDQGVGWKRGRG